MTTKWPRKTKIQKITKMFVLYLAQNYCFYKIIFLNWYLIETISFNYLLKIVEQDITKLKAPLSFNATNTINFMLKNQQLC